MLCFTLAVYQHHYVVVWNRLIPPSSQHIWPACQLQLIKVHRVHLSLTLPVRAHQKAHVHVSIFGRYQKKLQFICWVCMQLGFFGGGEKNFQTLMARSTKAAMVMMATLTSECHCHDNLCLRSTGLVTLCDEKLSMALFVFLKR